jgi:hypothetical protein
MCGQLDMKLVIGRQSMVTAKFLNWSVHHFSRCVIVDGPQSTESVKKVRVCCEEILQRLSPTKNEFKLQGSTITEQRLDRHH